MGNHRDAAAVAALTIVDLKALAGWWSTIATASFGKRCSPRPPRYKSRHGRGAAPVALR